jgi:hypothetical protein
MSTFFVSFLCQDKKEKKSRGVPIAIGRRAVRVMERNTEVVFRIRIGSLEIEDSRNP